MGRTMRAGVFAAVVSALFLMSAGEAAAQKILISINKVSQKMTVSVDGEQKYVWLVSTGAPGYDTPSGTYQPFRMEATHFSQEWDDSPMPHSIFFTPDGHAIHGSYYTKRLGTGVSHGCVRLLPDNATKLFAMVQDAGMKNTTVVIKGGLFDFGGGDISLPDFKLPKASPVTDFKKLFNSKSACSKQGTCPRTAPTSYASRSSERAR